MGHEKVVVITRGKGRWFRDGVTTTLVLKQSSNADVTGQGSADETIVAVKDGSR